MGPALRLCNGSGMAALSQVPCSNKAYRINAKTKLELSRAHTAQLLPLSCTKLRALQIPIDLHWANNLIAS